MTYQKFCDIIYDTEKEKDYLCWNLVHLTCPKPKTKEKYQYYTDKMRKIKQFKKEVLTKALANLPDDYFS